MMMATQFPGPRLSYLRPRQLGAALEALSGGALTVLAGGTDLYAAREAITGDVLDIGALDALRGIRFDSAGWHIGALTTWSALSRCPLPPMFDGLKAAAREIGGLQVQNRGTIGGNLCNASAAADGIPPLLALDATVELTSLAGRRELPMGQFLLGSRRTARRADELLTCVHVPVPGGTTRSLFRKLGARHHLVISIAAVAVSLTMDDSGRIARAGVAVGACAPAAIPLEGLAQALVGQPLHALRQVRITDEDLAALRPRDDIRATAVYRRDAVRTLLADALRELSDG